MALNPLRNFHEPLLAGLLFALAGVALASPVLGGLGGALLAVLGARVAYDHRGAGRHVLPETFAAPQWLRRQLTGALLFSIALAFVAGSLRHVGVG